MLIFPNQRLVFFAVPKTGTTAIEAGLRCGVDGAIAVDENRKHMNVRQFRLLLADDLVTEWGSPVEGFALLRDPLERLKSWYRYRRRLDGSDPKSTAAVSFEQFIAGVLNPEPPGFADVGNQWIFATDKAGRIGIDHLFTVEQPGPFHRFVADRFGISPAFQRLNVSEPAETQLDPALESELRNVRRDEFALYEQVRAAGHYRADVSPRS